MDWIGQLAAYLIKKGNQHRCHPKSKLAPLNQLFFNSWVFPTFTFFFLLFPKVFDLLYFFLNQLIYQIPFKAQNPIAVHRLSLPRSHASFNTYSLHCHWNHHQMTLLSGFLQNIIYLKQKRTHCLTRCSMFSHDSMRI